MALIIRNTYEYMTVNMGAVIMDPVTLLNRYGADGWELISVSQSNIVVFKRLTGTIQVNL